MPTVIVEDGLGVAEANSYASVQEAITYATGLNLDDTAGVVTAYLINACLWLETQYKFNGFQTFQGQPLSFPRSFMGLFQPINLGVPFLVKQAQLQLVVEQAKGIQLFKSAQNSKGRVTQDSVDIFRTSYNVSGSVNKPSMPLVDAMLTKYVLSSASFKGSNRI